MTVKLLVVQGSTANKELTLRRTRTVAGRKKGCKLRILSDLVSRIHCSFVCDGTRVSVKDLGSSNGTFVNGARISEAALRAGDVVQIGPIQFVVQIVQDAPVGAKASVPASTAKLPEDEVVFFESDDAAGADEILEADLLENPEQETKSATKSGGNEPIALEENIFASDSEPLDAAQFLVDDADNAGEYRIAESDERRTRRRRS